MWPARHALSCRPRDLLTRQIDPICADPQPNGHTRTAAHSGGYRALHPPERLPTEPGWLGSHGASSASEWVALQGRPVKGAARFIRNWPPATLDSPALPGGFWQPSDQAPPRLSKQPGDRTWHRPASPAHSPGPTNPHASPTHGSRSQLADVPGTQSLDGSPALTRTGPTPRASTTRSARLSS